MVRATSETGKQVGTLTEDEKRDEPGADDVSLRIDWNVCASAA